MIMFNCDAQKPATNIYNNKGQRIYKREENNIYNNKGQRIYKIEDNKIYSNKGQVIMKSDVKAIPKAKSGIKK